MEWLTYTHFNHIILSGFPAISMDFHSNPVSQTQQKGSLDELS